MELRVSTLSISLAAQSGALKAYNWKLDRCKEDVKDLDKSCCTFAKGTDAAILAVMNSVLSLDKTSQDILMNYDDCRVKYKQLLEKQSYLEDETHG